MEMALQIKQTTIDIQLAFDKRCTFKCDKPICIELKKNLFRYYYIF